MDENQIKATDTNVEKAYCEYCGKLRPVSELKRETIYRNGRQVEGLYCADDGCANYAQMSAEG